jgi:hypothetical protein
VGSGAPPRESIEPREKGGRAKTLRFEKDEATLASQAIILASAILGVAWLAMM